MHQKPFGGRALPGPTGRAYSAPPDPLTGLRGWVPGEETGGGWGGEWRKGEGKGGRKRKGGEGNGREGFCLG